MFMDCINERETRFGVVRKGDLAVIRFTNGTICVVLFRALFDGKKNHVCLETFSPQTGSSEKKELSWENFEEKVSSCNIFGKLEVSDHHWGSFVRQYRNFLLFQSAERVINDITGGRISGPL